MNRAEREIVVTYAIEVPLHVRKLFWSYYRRNRRMMIKAGAGGFIGSASSAQQEALYRTKAN